MTTLTVLVYPAEAENAFEVARALRGRESIKVIGASSRRGHARFVFDDCIEDAPNIDDAAFDPWLDRLQRDKQINAFLPTHDHVAWRIHHAKRPTGLRLIGSSAATAAICASKLEMTGVLRHFEWHPQVHDATPASFPVFAKPDRSAGGKGTARLDNLKAWTDFFDHHPREHYLVTDYLPGAEFTVDCFTDRHGKLLFVGPRSREAIRAGIAMQSQAISAEPFLQIARDLHATLEFRGYWFFQTKLDIYGKHRFLEASCRAAAGIGLHRQAGVNLPLLGLLDGFDRDVSILRQPFTVRASRALTVAYDLPISFSRLYIDLDDTLLIAGQPNVTAMALVYGCRQRRIRCHLITRHAGDPIATLRSVLIEPAIFDEIIHLDWSQKKQDFIQPDSIFIDNSFAEREAVSSRCGIPVFDVDAIPTLLTALLGEIG